MCQNQSIGCYGNESDSIFFLFDIMSTIPALDGAVIIKKTDETVIIYLLCSLLFFVSDY